MPQGLKLVKGAPPKLTLVYGLRLFEADTVAGIEDAKMKLKNGNPVRVTMHLIEGTRAQVKRQLMRSLDAFFELLGEEKSKPIRSINAQCTSVKETRDGFEIREI